MNQSDILLNNQNHMVLGHGLGQGLVPGPAHLAHQAQQAAAYAPESAADTLARDKQRMFAKAEVLEYFEAQLRMNLFNDELVHRQIFEDAIAHAVKRILTP
jgi:hypothetical protein